MSEQETSKSILDPQVQITGTITTPGSIQIDGKLDGDLQCGGDAQIGKSAVIKGNLAVNSITVAGNVSGNITAKDRIEMKSTARVMGDIKSKRLAVEDGVTFVGKSEVNPSGTGGSQPAEASKPAAEASKEPPAADSRGGVFSGRKS